MTGAVGVEPSRSARGWYHDQWTLADELAWIAAQVRPSTLAGYLAGLQVRVWGFRPGWRLTADERTAMRAAATARLGELRSLEGA